MYHIQTTCEDEQCYTVLPDHVLNLALSSEYPFKICYLHGL